MIKDILDNDVLYARIVKSSHNVDEVEFFTREDDSIQVGVLNYPKSYKTGAHYHNKSEKLPNQTDEILIVQKGSARVDFFNLSGVYLKSCEVFEGDILIIYLGGHNIFYYEDSKILMIKNGPYEEALDKIRIIGANNLEVKIEE